MTAEDEFNTVLDFMYKHAINQSFVVIWKYFHKRPKYSLRYQLFLNKI
jgi:hypothetical protein